MKCWKLTVLLYACMAALFYRSSDVRAPLNTCVRAYVCICRHTLIWYVFVASPSASHRASSSHAEVRAQKHSRAHAANTCSAWTSRRGGTCIRRCHVSIASHGMTCDQGLVRVVDDNLTIVVYSHGSANWGTQQKGSPQATKLKPHNPSPTPIICVLYVGTYYMCTMTPIIWRPGCLELHTCVYKHRQSHNCHDHVNHMMFWKQHIFHRIGWKGRIWQLWQPLTDTYVLKIAIRCPYCCWAPTHYAPLSFLQRVAAFTMIASITIMIVIYRYMYTHTHIHTYTYIHICIITIITSIVIINIIIITIITIIKGMLSPLAARKWVVSSSLAWGDHERVCLAAYHPCRSESTTLPDRLTDLPKP